MTRSSEMLILFVNHYSSPAEIRYRIKSSKEGFLVQKYQLLWQPLITKTNDHTNNKSLKADIKQEVHKRTEQGISAKLESYIYKVHMVHATNNYTCPHIHTTSLYLSHFLLKATILYTCTLMSSSRSFYYILGL